MNSDEKINKKQAKEQAKYEKQMEKERIKDEKERIRNSFGHRFKSFILTIIFVIILAIAGFFGLKYYLGEKQTELYNEEMNYYYSKGEEYLKNGEYEKAIIMFEKVEKNADKYKDAQAKIDETVKGYIEDYISEANKYIDSKEYDKAISIFDELSDELKNTDEVQEAIANIVVKKVENKIESEENLYKQIIMIYEESEQSLNTKSEEAVEELLTEKINKFEEEVKSEISAKSYEKYSKEIIEIKEKIKDNDTINKIEELIEGYKPQDLLSFDYEKEETITTSKDGYSYVVTDVKGDKYTDYILVNESSKLKENKITWKLDGEYSLLSGRIAISDEIGKVTSKGVKVSVIGDGKTIYKSKKLKNKTAPFDFSVDISGVKELKIVLESDKGISYIIGSPVIVK